MSQKTRAENIAAPVDLSPDEAIEAILTSDHPEGAAGSVEMDAGLIELIRGGLMSVCRFPDGRLAFSPTQKLRELSDG